MKTAFLQNSFRLLKLSISCLILIPFLLTASGIEDAITYHNNSMMQWNVAIDTIDSISWEGNERVLDVGCGDGKITALLAQKLPYGSVIGVDVSKPMIEFASSHYPEETYPNLSFQQLDATEISFENQFDRVVSFSTLHWVIEQGKALKAMHRALVPGGTVHIQTYGTGFMNVTVIGDTLIHTEKWAQHFSSYIKQRAYFTDEEYQTLLENAGFQQVVIMGSLHETLFVDRQALTDFAKPLLTFIRHLPIELQDEFTEEVIDKIISIAGISDDGLIHYKTFNLKAFGSK